jgi:hypothetical protein
MIGISFENRQDEDESLEVFKRENVRKLGIARYPRRPVFIRRIESAYS